MKTTTTMLIETIFWLETIPHKHDARKGLLDKAHNLTTVFYSSHKKQRINSESRYTHVSLPIGALNTLHNHSAILDLTLHPVIIVM